MIDEALVIFSCLNNTGCSEAGANYYSKHKSLQEQVQEDEKQIKNIVNPFIVDYILPIAATAAGASYNIKLNKECTFKMGNKQIQLNFTREW